MAARSSHRQSVDIYEVVDMRRSRTVLSVTIVAIAVLVGAVAGLIATKAVLATPVSSDCASGGAVADAANNPGLVSDCEALLASRDTLAGRETLNWVADRPIREWEGVTVGGAPRRIVGLALSDKQLTGTIQAELGNLESLQVLNLRNNQLSGGIPRELANLSDLFELWLSGHRLTGPIPTELGNLSNLAGC